MDVMTNDHRRSRMPERPRVEPEIIPPGEDWPRGGYSGSYRIYIARPGPLAMSIALVLVVLAVVTVVFLLVSAVVVWIPLALAAFGAAVLFAYGRHYWLRLQRWLSR
jgi:hypothetical protein